MWLCRVSATRWVIMLLIRSLTCRASQTHEVNVLKVNAYSKFGDPKKSGGCTQSGMGSRLSVDPAARHSWVSVCKKEVLLWQKKAPSILSHLSPCHLRWMVGDYTMMVLSRGGFKTANFWADDKAARVAKEVVFDEWHAAFGKNKSSQYVLLLFREILLA